MRQSFRPRPLPHRGFNPRTHEGCDRKRSRYKGTLRGFNPRTHEGCDSCDDITCFPKVVSIHAPTRGATLLSSRKNALPTSFNPRTHEGCDFVPHAERNKHYRFQSTHPRGVRLTLPIYFDTFTEFQSTHPRGVRPFLFIATSPPLRFNPRTHEGCDTSGISGTDNNQVSIHAPTRGATPDSYF